MTIPLQEEVIDIDMIAETYPASADNWIPELQLYNEDKNILCSSTAWLNDLIINAAHLLLKAINPHLSGFQNPVLGQCLAFDVESEEFVQVLHDGHGHWLTVSTDGTYPLVNVYDSLYSALSPSSKLQIASLLFTTHKQISLSFKDVQMQARSSDCGLFAIAFATAIAFMMDPGCFLFEQKKF